MYIDNICSALNPETGKGSCGMHPADDCDGCWENTWVAKCSTSNDILGIISTMSMRHSGIINATASCHDCGNCSQ